MCKVTIAGDLAPLSVNQNLFEKGDANLILNDLVIDSDLFVANLECPITNSENPIKKSGPNIKASLGAVNGVKSVGIELVNLSNNHILDFGEKGFQDTITELTNSQIEYFGAGKNIKKANAVHVNEISGLRIGFYGVSEFEWSIATDDSSGANPIDRINFLEAKKKLELDHLIVFIHGGKEHYNLPTPKLQKLARFYADYGASAVICQHTHIVGCYEIYNKIPIFYGQGNFIFNNPNNTSQDWNSGYLINLDLGKKEVAFSLTFFSQKPEGGVEKMKFEEALIKSFNERSRRILNPEYVKQEWDAVCEREGWKYERQLTGLNKRLYNVIRKFKFPNMLFQKTKTASQLAMLRCETHREVLETYLKNKHDYESRTSL